MLVDRREDRHMKAILKRKARHIGAADEQEVSLNWTPEDKDVVSVEEKDLLVGDYILGDGQCGIERKSDDFRPELQNGNLWLKLEELRQFPLHILLIDKDLLNLINEGMEEEDDFSREKARICGAIASCIVRGYVPLFTTNKSLAAEILVRLDKKLRDGKDRTVVDAGRRYATMADHSIGILQRFPGIGVIKAKSLLSNFKDLRVCLEFLMDIGEKDIVEVRKAGLTSRDKTDISRLMSNENLKYRKGHKGY